MKHEATHLLLVEGSADRDFFNQVCKLLDLHKNPRVEVVTPQDYSIPRGGKEDVLKLLPRFLNDIADDNKPLTYFAIVVDADKKEHGSGCDKTLEQVKALLGKDYSLKENNEDGFIFKHSDGFSDFGLWIMPDNQNEGILEDFIQCVVNQEDELFNHAVKTVEKLEPKKFANHHHSKAEIATWLAWQKPPGRGVYCTIEDNLLNTDHDLFKKMKAWLNAVFAE
jgi:hypothetical protein